MIDASYLQLLCNKSSFNRTELQEAMKVCGLNLVEVTFKKKLQEHLTQKQIIRVGCNAHRIQSLRKQSKRNPVLLERTIYAFGLVEALA